MLTKRQLEDATNCWFGNCKECSCNGLQKEYGAFDCMARIIETTLTYRDMLHRMIDGVDYCPVCGQDKPGHKPDCELAALLKESEVEHDAV